MKRIQRWVYIFLYILLSSGVFLFFADSLTAESLSVFDDHDDHLRVADFVDNSVDALPDSVTLLA